MNPRYRKGEMTFSGFADFMQSSGNHVSAIVDCINAMGDKDKRAFQEHLKSVRGALLESHSLLSSRGPRSTSVLAADMFLVGFFDAVIYAASSKSIVKVLKKDS